MPEIKHNFTSGKMNKDLDERLIPNGEYRDAVNVQVSTSEGSDVGVIQNILGNAYVDSYVKLILLPLMLFVSVVLQMKKMINYIGLFMMRAREI